MNPVNCVGVMGAGLAKQFKLRYPDYYEEYKVLCLNGLLRPGVAVIGWKFDEVPYIANFPTKNHWREQSSLENIATALKSLVEQCLDYNFNSVAMPKIGCGLGGLDWKVVKPMIEEAFKDTGIEIEYFEGDYK